MKYIITLILLFTFNFSKAQYLVDLSDSSSISIDEPQLAYVNITGVDLMPVTKTDDLHAWFEYSDEKGNYFKKKIILNAQGASSLQYEKKNFSVDFCEDEWIGDDKTEFKIGNWVKQSGFHFKASWIDSFRGGLAVATAYKFYDDIVADEQPILERAGLENYSKKALCHPDCFPCVVSLNGVFYGIYAWQLKKNHKNMGMDKDNTKHVWFQIDSYGSDYDTNIDIKNPKEVTDEVKMCIQNIVTYNTEMDSLDSLEFPKEHIRAELYKQLDIPSVIDFIIHGLITANIDGFGKNVNFFTYDGVKWFVTPYDLDETFGNTWISSFQFPPEWSFFNNNYEMTGDFGYYPFYWIKKYFSDDIEKRYAELRESNVISTDKILSHLIDWNERIGNDNYLKEYSKWSKCPSNGSTIINDKWEWIKDWTNYSALDEYDIYKNYNIGDSCTYDYRIFVAKENVKGIKPIVQSGYTDSVDRVREWVERRIALEDKFLNYKKEDGIENIELTENKQKSHKFISSDKKIYIKKGNDIYSAVGQKVK